MLKIAFQAALLAATLQVPALANEYQPDVRVYYGDLDLADPAGVKTFDRRLAAAVNAACPNGEGVREVARLHAIALCRAAKRAEVAPLRETALAVAERGRTEFAKAR